MIAKAQAGNKKEKLDFTITKKICASKDTIKKLKR